jgi:hypothetical protein
MRSIAVVGEMWIQGWMKKLSSAGLKDEEATTLTIIL